MHQDIISYAEGLRTKVTALIDRAVSVLSEAYEQFKNFPLHSTALLELEKNSEEYEFEHFAVKSQP